jgi:hypothetical protein
VLLSLALYVLFIAVLLSLAMYWLILYLFMSTVVYVLCRPACIDAIVTRVVKLLLCRSYLAHVTVVMSDCLLLLSCASVYCKLVVVVVLIHLQ